MATLSRTMRSRVFVSTSVVPLNRVTWPRSSWARIQARPWDHTPSALTKSASSVNSSASAFGSWAFHARTKRSTRACGRSSSAAHGIGRIKVETNTASSVLLIASLTRSGTYER